MFRIKKTSGLYKGVRSVFEHKSDTDFHAIWAHWCHWWLKLADRSEAAESTTGLFTSEAVHGGLHCRPARRRRWHWEQASPTWSASFLLFLLFSALFKFPYIVSIHRADKKGREVMLLLFHWTRNCGHVPKVPEIIFILVYLAPYLLFIKKKKNEKNK